MNSSARVNQQMGANVFARTTVNRARLREQSTGWGLAQPPETRDLAKRIYKEQKEYQNKPLDNQKPTFDTGFVLQIKNANDNDLMAIRFSDWTSNWNNTTSNFNEISSFNNNRRN